MIACNKDDDNKAPTCTIGVIQNNMEILKGTPISFPVYAEDEDGNISSVFLTIDGEGYDTASIAPYEFSWTTGDKTAGPHTINAMARNDEGETATHEITVKVITSGNPVTPCPEAITISYAGQTYNTIKIGEQCWLKENLNVTTENSLIYNDDPNNSDFYGQLYNWEDANTVCPPGWRLPDFDDWCTLVQHVDASTICTQDTDIGTDAGFKLKSNGGWLNGQIGSDQFGFRALPGGFKATSGTFTDIGKTSAFWSSTDAGGGTAGFWSMTTETTRIANNKAPATDALSVRCVKE